jgi:hypothetical protein
LLKNCQDFQSSVQSFVDKKKIESTKINSLNSNFNDNTPYIKNQNIITEYISQPKLIHSDNRLHTQYSDTSVNDVKVANIQSNNHAYDFTVLKNSLEPGISFVKPSSSFKKQNNNGNSSSQRNNSNDRFLNSNVSIPGNTYQPINTLNDSLLNFSTTQTNYSQLNQFTNYPQYGQNSSNINFQNPHSPK